MIERAFRGFVEQQEYFRTLEEVEGLTISPGGAAQILGCTRQHVSKLAESSPEIRAWAFYPDGAKYAGYVEISVLDLVKYGLRQGRFSSVWEVGLLPENLKEELENLISNNS